MVKGQNIVHQYFKKHLPDGFRILVKVDPIRYIGTEITLSPEGQVHARDMVFGEEIFADLQADQFELCSPLEFNLYLAGLA